MTDKLIAQIRADREAGRLDPTAWSPGTYLAKMEARILADARAIEAALRLADFVEGACFLHGSDAGEAVVKEYPVAAGTAKLMDPEMKGYGSIRNARDTLAKIKESDQCRMKRQSYCRARFVAEKT